MDKEPELGVMARGQVVRVIDGDTVIVNMVIPVRVRMRDCWAPETRGESKAEGLKSKAELAKVLKRGKVVRVHVPTMGADEIADVLTFGRVLGTIWAMIKPGRRRENVSTWMVSRGLATKEKQR